MYDFRKKVNERRTKRRANSFPGPSFSGKSEKVDRKALKI